jgi:hypothetical protein
MIIDLFRALQAGKELSNAETWKRVQLWSSNLTILLGAGVSIAAALGHPIPITPEQINTLISAIIVVVGVFNSYAIVATTKRIGVSTPTDPVNSGIVNTSGYSSTEGSGVSNLDNGNSNNVPLLEKSGEAGLWFKELDDRGFDNTK